MAVLENNAIAKPHIRHRYDGELGYIYDLILEMISLIQNQWDLVIEALDDANLESALDVVAETGGVRDYESNIDQAILSLLAKESPVASDLRMVLSISKISVAMKYLGEEVAEIAKLILVLYEPRNGTPNAQLVADVAQISRDIRAEIGNLAEVLSALKSAQAHMLLQYDSHLGEEIQEAFTRQLTFIDKDLRQIRPALTIMQIMKSLESSADHCKNLAEYCIFMIDGQDLRHIGRNN